MFHSYHHLPSRNIDEVEQDDENVPFTSEIKTCSKNYQDADAWIMRQDRLRRVNWLCLLINLILFTTSLACLGLSAFWRTHAISSTELATTVITAQDPENAAKDGLRFGWNEVFMSLEHKYDHLWDSELDTRNGVIRLVDIGPEEYGSISMFHQLHCLAAVRKAVQHAHDADDANWFTNGHWHHCFDYLRSSILCHADSLVERPFNWIGERIHAITGMADVRTCGNTAELYRVRATFGQLENPPEYKDAVSVQKSYNNVYDDPEDLITTSTV